jgi:aminoglycoside 6'-N-acetyltransferase
MSERDAGGRIAGHSVELRPATEDDVPLLTAWHSDAEIARYWDGRTYTRDEMRQRLRRPGVEPFLIEHAGTAIGYLQIWRASDGGAGIDLFLVPAARGRGFGSDSLRASARHVLEVRGWPRVVAEVYAWNADAVRAFRSAGFDTVEENEPDDEHRARWLLMQYFATVES